MASFKVKLFIDDEERNVLNVDQSFRQIVDITGKPEGIPYGEPLFLSLESTVSDGFFYHHAFSSSSMISGELVFYKRDGFSVLHKLEFANAHILGLTEEFDAYSGDPLHFNLKIGWGIVRINGVIFQEAWNLDNPWEAGAEATVIEETEGAILEVYYEDREGNRIEQIRKNKDIVVVVISENMSGQTIDVDLSDDVYNFEFEGEILENDLLSNYQVNADTIRIPLKTIKQS